MRYLLVFLLKPPAVGFLQIFYVVIRRKAWKSLVVSPLKFVEIAERCLSVSQKLGCLSVDESVFKVSWADWRSTALEFIFHSVHISMPICWSLLSQQENKLFESVTHYAKILRHKYTHFQEHNSWNTFLKYIPEISNRTSTACYL